MAIKQNGKMCSIKEQTIEDLATGITLKFKKYKNDRGEDQVKLTLRGNLPYGRDIIFDDDGKKFASGTALV